MSRTARRDALAPVIVRGETYDDLGYCYEPYRDGPTIHTTFCARHPEDTGFSSNACIQPGQDGAAVQAAREAAADERRFTPPEFRSPGGKPPRRKPGEIISATQGQVTEVVALRGRPRIADSPGESGEWSTWETFTHVDPDYAGHRMAEHLYQVPKHLTEREARDIVAEFNARVPHYEFQVVHAWLSIEEDVLA